MKTVTAVCVSALVFSAPTFAQEKKIWDPIFGPAKGKIEAFCKTIKNTNRDRVSIAVLPFLYSDQEFEKKPWQVKEGSLRVARGVVDVLRDQMPRADILNPTDVALRFDDVGLSPMVFETARAARKGAHQLGVDVLFFGRIVRKAKDGGASSAKVYRFQMQALQVRSGKTVALEEWNIGSHDSTVRRFFESLRDGEKDEEWEVVKRWSVSPKKDLKETMSLVRSRLERRVERVVKATVRAPAKEKPPANKNVMVAPADFGARDELQTRLMKHQMELEDRLADLSRIGARTNSGPDRSQPVKVGGVTYPSYTAAKAEIDELAKRVHNSKTGQFCKQFSETIAEDFRKNGGKVLQADRLEQSTRLLLTGVLKSDSGDLAKKPDLLAELRKQGLGTIVVPYLEWFAEEKCYAIRARIVNVSEPSEVRTVFVTIDSRLSPQFEKLALAN